MSSSRSARRQNDTATATRHQRQGRRHVPQADLDRRARHAGASCSLTRPWATSRPSSSRTTQSAILRAWSRSWVTSTVETLDPLAQVQEGRLHRATSVVVESRGGLVEQQDPRLQRQRPRQHRPLLLSHRELAAVACGEARRRGRRGRAAGRRRARARPGRRRTGCCAPRSPPAAPEAAAPGRPLAAARVDRARAHRLPRSEPSPTPDRRGG